MDSNHVGYEENGKWSCNIVGKIEVKLVHL